MNRFGRLLIVLVLLAMTSSAVVSVKSSTDVPQAAQQLTIVVQAVSHLSGCVQMSVAARGDSIPFLINVTYASTGLPMSNGTVQVHLLNGRVLQARYSGATKLWAAVYLIPWNNPTGPLDYYVTASAVDGSYGTWKPISPYGFITIVPANLHVVASVVDEKTNQTVDSVSREITIKIIATVALPLPGEGYPTQVTSEPAPVDGAGRVLNATTVSKVEAIVGQGTFNATTERFTGFTASSITLSYDVASSKWVGSYNFAQSTPPGQYEVIVLAADRASPPNTNFSVANTITLGGKSGGIDTGTVFITSFGMIIVGFVAGLAIIYKFALPKHQGD